MCSEILQKGTLVRSQVAHAACSCRGGIASCQWAETRQGPSEQVVFAARSLLRRSGGSGVIQAHKLSWGELARGPQASEACPALPSRELACSVSQNAFLGHFPGTREAAARSHYDFVVQRLHH